MVVTLTDASSSCSLVLQSLQSVEDGLEEIKSRLQGALEITMTLLARQEREINRRNELHALLDMKHQIIIKHVDNRNDSEPCTNEGLDFEEEKLTTTSTNDHSSARICTKKNSPLDLEEAHMATEDSVQELPALVKIRRANFQQASKIRNLLSGMRL